VSRSTLFLFSALAPRIPRLRGGLRALRLLPAVFRPDPLGFLERY